MQESNIVVKIVALEFHFPCGSAVKTLLAMQKMRAQSLGWEDTLEEEMAIHSIILVWKIPWTEERGGLQSVGSQDSTKDTI